MTEYRVHFSGTAGAVVVVETDETDPEEIVQAALEEGIPGLCAQCSGWGRRDSLELPEEWEEARDEGGPIIYTDGERHIVDD